MVHTPISFTASDTMIGWESSHAEVLSSHISDVEGLPQAGPVAQAYASLTRPDRSIEENRNVHCPIIWPERIKAGKDADRVCILLHGLNERGWDKYQSWAHAIADKANCAVILFPIAFHMDRSPETWASFPIMRGVSKDRVARIPGLRQSSMANAAISERLDEAPSRFYLSGLMAALDLGDLIAEIKKGSIPGIGTNPSLGFFGYSIGTFLLQCLSLGNPGFAAAGKRFLFCGGPYLSAMQPVSKYIMDSLAHERLLDFWVRNLEEELRKDDELAALIDTPEGRGYCAMVDPRHPQLNRREFFSDGNTQVASLVGDEVMPKAAILESFAGTGVAPTFFELPPSCTHITPLNPLGGQVVADAFEELFDMATEHLFG